MTTSRDAEKPVLVGYRFQVARGAERERALAFQSEIYARELPHVPGDEAGAILLVATDADGAIVASFRLLPPEVRPFDFESLVDVSDLLAPSTRAALVGRLCVRPDHREIRRGMFLHTSLLKLTQLYLVAHGITDLFLYTFDHLLSFYRVAFFRNLERPFVHPEWGRIHLMHLDVAALAARVAESKAPMARLLREPAGPEFEL